VSLARATRLVARREFSERIRSRAFQISLVITVLVVAAVGIIAGVVGDDGPKEYTVGAVGPTAQVVAAAAQVSGRAADVRIEVEDQPSVAAARAGVRDESLDAALAGPSIVSLSDPPSELVQLLQQSSRLVRTEQALQREGLSASERRRALQQPPLRTVSLEGEDDGGEGVAFVASLVLYLQLITYGIAVASGVVEEKASRVVEVLLATVEPRAILAGKILGIGALGLLQLALTAVVGLAAAGASGAIELDAGDAGTLAVVLVWFLFGYLLWSSLYAMAGVMVSRQEDLQSPTTVLTILLVIGYLIAFPSIDDPDGTLALVASLIPLFAPIIMPLRVALDAASGLEIAASLAFLIAAIALLVPLGARLYERSVLRMGKPMKLREAWRAARA
jgi:ABC-2 type transport system permease protein